MGILQSELVPISSTGPTTLIPSAKNVLTKVFQVTRANATATLKCVLPAQASILEMTRLGSVVSNAVTTATVTFSVFSNAGVLATAADDVKTNGATTGPVQLTNLPNIQPVPLTGDIQITAVYADTGGAATLGGPWNYVVYYTA